MAIFNFPDAPAYGDVYADVDSGAEYIWAGTKWQRTKAAPSIIWPLPPIVELLTPNYAPIGSPDVTLTVSGNLFVFNCFIEADGVAMPTTYISGRELRTTLPSTTAQATLQITVYDPAKALASTPPLPFNWSGVHLARLSPDTLVFGVSAGITAVGDYFTAACVVQVDGVDCPTTFYSVTNLNFQLPVAMAPSVVSVAVYDPVTLSTSAPLPFTWTAPPRRSARPARMIA